VPHRWRYGERGKDREGEGEVRKRDGGERAMEVREGDRVREGVEVGVGRMEGRR